MQPDLFDETLEKKILRMEKWIHRLHKELFFLKEVHALKRGRKPGDAIAQLDIFGGTGA